MVSFISHNIKDFTDTCKFWKVALKNKHIKDCYIGYTSGSINWCALNESEEYLFNHYHNLDIKEFVINNGGWDNCNIELIEECQWQTKQHAESRQKELANSLPNATYNHCKRCRTQEEEQQLEEMRKERAIQYEIDNYDKIHARKTKQVVCDVCGAQFQHQHKSKHMKTNKHQLALTKTNSEA